MAKKTKKKTEKKVVKRPVGRPRKYITPTAMQEAIEGYFQKCKKEERSPTICGLAIALDFVSRNSLLNYEGYSKEFFGIIKRAKLTVEDGYEQDLRGKNPTGPIFALKQFDWRDKTETVHEVGDGMKELIKDISGRGQGIPITTS